MEPTFRRADDGDVDLLVEFMRQHYADEQARFDESYARTALEHLIASEALGSVYLIQQDEAACGYIAVAPGYSLRLHGPTVWVDEIYVRAQHRRDGIEKAALQFVCDTYAQGGMEAVCIAPGRGDESAARAAHVLGFRDSGRSMLTKWLDR